MQATMIGGMPQRSFAVALGAGDELLAALRAFLIEHRLGPCQITGLGAFSGCVLGHFDPEDRKYRKIAIREQVEVLSLIGDVAFAEGIPRVHLQAVVGLPEGITRGGLLLKARVKPALELIVTELPGGMRRGSIAGAPRPTLCAV